MNAIGLAFYLKARERDAKDHNLEQKQNVKNNVAKNCCAVLTSTIN